MSGQAPEHIRKISAQKAARLFRQLGTVALPADRLQTVLAEELPRRLPAGVRVSSLEQLGITLLTSVRMADIFDKGVTIHKLRNVLANALPTTAYEPQPVIVKRVEPFGTSRSGFTSLGIRVDSQEIQEELGIIRVVLRRFGVSAPQLEPTIGFAGVRRQDALKPEVWELGRRLLNNLLPPKTELTMLPISTIPNNPEVEHFTLRTPGQQTSAP